MATGDIGSVIDTLEFDATWADMPSVCHVSGDVYAIAYRGPDIDGWICTFQVSSVGVLPAAIIDSWEFDPSYGHYPEIIKIYETVYAIVYTDSAVQGILFTFSIANDGTITKSRIATGQFSAGNCNPEHLLKIADNIFAVVFTDGSAHGWVQTLEIANDGTIDDYDLSKLEFDPALGREGFLCHISGDVYAIAYRGPGDDGWLCTLSISSAGTVSGSVIDTLEFDTGVCVEPSMVNARDNFFAIAYSGPGADGWLKIVTIADNGAITDPPVDSYEFDPVLGTNPWLYSMGEGYIALTYIRSGGTLWAYTFLVDAAGSVNATVLDSAQISIQICTFSILLNLSGDYCLVVYAGPDYDGSISTFTIEMPVVPSAAPHLMMGIA